MAEQVQTMQCMEVWGGNQAVSSALVMAGLDGWIYSRPYQSQAGGDVYYISSCATGRISRILVADVSGHGDMASATAHELRRLMRTFINYVDQTSFVEEMNRQFAAVSGVHRFATAVVITFFNQSDYATFSLAGHPAPLWYRAQSGQWQFVPRTLPAASRPADADMPLGIYDRTAYSQADLLLEPGDMVLCYTDAFIEAHDAAGEALGTEGLLEMVRGIPPSQPERIIGELLHKVAAAYPGNLDDDDVTALLFRPIGRRAGLDWRRHLASPWAFLRSAAHTIRSGEPFGWPEFNLANVGGFFSSRLGRRWRGVSKPQARNA